MTARDGCVFCGIVRGVEPATFVARWDDAVAIRPLSPVTKDHVLVLPRRHVADAVEDPDVTAVVARHAAELAAKLAPANLITSVGAEATQTVFHLHLHVVPRRVGDGLRLPWDDGRGVRVSDAAVRFEDARFEP